MKRIFIVGIARSGTTLLQSLLGSHPQITTFPESHFFDRTIPRQQILRRLKKIKSSDIAEIRSFLDQIDKLEVFKNYTGSRFNYNSWCKYLISIYDGIAKTENKNTWLEKTPLNLYYTDFIERNTSNVHFIHIVRDPMENTAALYDVSKKHPDDFAQDTIEKAWKRYKKEVEISNSKIKLANHHIVYYEDLVDHTHQVLKETCGNIDLKFDEKMLDYSKTASSIQTKDETWKANNENKIQKYSKVDERLNTNEKNYLLDQVGKLKLEILSRYE